jgi:P pilus assembly chaperone PapD
MGSLGTPHWFSVTIRVLIMSLLYLVTALAGLSAGRKRPISQSKVKSIADLALRNQGEYKMVVYEVSTVV